MNNKTTDCAIISHVFDCDMTYYCGDRYNDFINDFSNFCKNVNCYPRVRTIDSRIANRKIKNPRYPNKSWLIHNCPAYFEASDYVKQMFPKYTQGMRIEIFDDITACGGTVVINGWKYYV